MCSCTRDTANASVGLSLIMLDDQNSTRGLRQISHNCLILHRFSAASATLSTQQLHNNRLKACRFWAASVPLSTPTTAKLRAEGPPRAGKDSRHKGSRWPQAWRTSGASPTRRLCFARQPSPWGRWLESFPARACSLSTSADFCIVTAASAARQRSGPQISCGPRSSTATCL